MSGALTVISGATGQPLAGFTLPLSSTFQIHTNALASATVPGIDAWFLLVDNTTLAGASPTSVGSDYQSYTMNTLAFIPGSDITGAVGIVSGKNSPIQKKRIRRAMKLWQ